MLGVMLERPALFDTVQVTVRVYVLAVVPLDAVTATLMVLAPAAREIAPEAEPDATVVPLTFTVASGSLVVGVTVKEVAATVAV